MPSIRWEDNNDSYPDDELDYPEIVRNLTELINHAILDAAQQVDRAYIKWNQKIRDRLRDETGFKLTRGEQKVAIKVEVSYGMPLALQQVLKSYDLQWAELLIHRGQFNDAASGMEVASNKLARITQVLRNSAPTPEEIDSFRTALALLTKLNAELAAKELTKTILTIKQDALGAYYYRAGKVRLFWLPIALVSMSGGHSIEALTFVTLAHELAHAYTGCSPEIIAVCKHCTLKRLHPLGPLPLSIANSPVASILFRRYLVFRSDMRIFFARYATDGHALPKSSALSAIARSSSNSVAPRRDRFQTIFITLIAIIHSANQRHGSTIPRT